MKSTTSTKIDPFKLIKHKACLVLALILSIVSSLDLYALIMIPCYTPGDCNDFECEETCCPPGAGGNGSGGRGGAGGPGGGGPGPGPIRREGCSDCSGMPVWRVSEPQINLWIDDEPLGYKPALGPAVSFKISYNQRSLLGANTNIFGVGIRWGCSWLSYIDVDAPAEGLAIPGGGYRRVGDCSTVPCPVDYYAQKRLTRPLTSSDPYTIEYPNGTVDTYGFFVTNSSGILLRAFLSKRTDPAGQSIYFDYGSYNPSSPIIRLLTVTDAEGRVTTINYVSSHPSDLPLISSVEDPFGRTTYLLYDNDGLLTNIVDVAGLPSSFTYEASTAWITNMTTPYGPTSFKLTASGAAWNGRAVEITEPNGSKQLYLSRDSASGVPSYYADVPDTSPFGNTLDNSGMDYRNTFHWNRLQYQSLSGSYLIASDISQLTADDFFIARMRHWLKHSSGSYVGKTLSMERKPSPDGVIEGQKTWYDYAGKSAYDTEGTKIMPLLVAQVLPDGNTWFERTERNAWNAETNNISTYTKPDGSIGLRTNTFAYAANGIDMTLHIGTESEQVSSNVFNAYHQVTTNYDALNQETRYTYDATTRLLTSAVTPGGLTTTNIYYSGGGSANRLEKTIDIEIARTNSYTYIGDLVYSHTDERGLTVTNYWDDLQRLTGQKFPDGTTTSNIYAALDITATKDRLGNWSYTGYNGIRQKIAETNANGVVTGYGLCDCGALLSVTNAWNTPVQMVTSFGYDFQGKRLYTYRPDATETNWFDALGRVIVTGDAWGYRWFYYNNQGLLTVVSNVYGAERVIVYDVDDHPLYVTDANGVTITNTYDELHRLSTRTYPDGGVERFGYSARGLTAYTNQLDFKTYYAYDEASRKTFETNANTEVIRYTNNAAGDLLSLTDGKTQTTKWKYDEYGRVTNKLDQAGVEILRYKYDPDNRLTNRWSKAMGDTKYKYDAVGSLTNIDYPSGTADVTFNYDALNRVTNMVDGVGATKYTYTAGGQLWTEDGPWSNDTLTNIYANRLRTDLNLQQSTALWTNRFVYDAAKRLTNVTSRAGTFSYLFDDAGSAGHLTKKITLPNGAYVTNTYDGMARLTGTYLKTSGNVLTNKHEYIYNQANQRTNTTRTDGSTVKYGYDNIGQLKVADSSVTGEDKGYAYDAAWNLNWRTNHTWPELFEADIKNQLTNSAMWECCEVLLYEYDHTGNLTVADEGNIRCDYDSENRLVKWYYLGNDADAYTQFVYDGIGRLRIRLEYLWDYEYEEWAPNGETRYIYDGMRVIQERHGNLPTVSYTRGSDLSGTLEGAGGIGGLLARSHSYSGGTGHWGTHNFYHADGNGNVTFMMNYWQSKVAEYRYDPFGNTVSKSGTLADINMYRFSSKEIHPVSGIYYYGYRFYVPNLQRWLNRDPIEERGFQIVYKGTAVSVSSGLNLEDSNLYTFVVNNPISLVDSFGLFYVAPTYPTNPLDAPPGPISCPVKIRTEVWQSHCNGNQPAGDGSCHEAHCIANCRMKRECHLGRLSAAAGSWYKEIKDGVIKVIAKRGDGFSDGDMQANRKGRRVASECPEKTCEEACAGTRF